MVEPRIWQASDNERMLAEETLRDRLTHGQLTPREEGLLNNIDIEQRELSVEIFMKPLIRRVGAVESLNIIAINEEERFNQDTDVVIALPTDPEVVGIYCARFRVKNLNREM